MTTFSAIKLDIDNIRDIRPDVLDDTGRMRILPAAYWAGVTMHERVAFCHHTGIYSIPTVELVGYLRDVIAGRDAIEIGAGNGVLAEALDIPATDNRQQEMPEYRIMYALSGQPPVRYGPNIIKLAAHAAIRRYNPEVVIGCWVTHRFDTRRPENEGNPVGVDESAAIDQVETYISIGNEFTHQKKPIWARPHQIVYPPWLVSRSHRPTARNYLATWNGGNDA